MSSHKRWEIKSLPGKETTWFICWKDSKDSAVKIWKGYFLAHHSSEGGGGVVQGSALVLFPMHVHGPLLYNGHQKSLFLFQKISNALLLCVCVHDGGLLSQCAYGDQRATLLSHFLLVSSHGFGELNSGHQACGVSIFTC